MVRPSPTGQYNILCNHLHFNEQGVEEVMPVDTKYIAIVRHPGTCFYIEQNYQKMSNGDISSSHRFILSMDVPFFLIF